MFLAVIAVGRFSAKYMTSVTKCRIALAGYAALCRIGFEDLDGIRFKRHLAVHEQGKQEIAKRSKLLIFLDDF